MRWPTLNQGHKQAHLDKQLKTGLVKDLPFPTEVLPEKQDYRFELL